MGEENTKICHPLLMLPQQPQPSSLKHVLSRSITNRFLLLQHNIYCLPQRIGSHCDTADIVIHSTVYIILLITWSRSDPTVVKKFQQQADREGRSLSPRTAYGMR